MKRELLEISDLLDDLLNGEISKNELQKRIEADSASHQRGYTPLTREEKNKMIRDGLTFDVAFRCFDDYMSKHNLAKSTVKQRHKRLRAFNRFLVENEIDFKSIKSKDLISYLSTKNRLKDSKSLSPHLINLRAFYNYLYEDKIIEYNPISSVMKEELKESRAYHKELEFLTSIQVKELIMSFDTTKENDLRTKATVMLILDAGLTLGEICKIKMEDIFWEEGVISITTARTSRRRNAFISDYTIRVLKSYINKFTINDGFLFIKLGTNQSLDEDAIYQVLKRKTDAIGFDVSSSVLRNTYVLHQMRNGHDAYSLQELLGYTTAKALAKYKSKEVIFNEK